MAVTHPAPGLTQWPAAAGITYALQWVLPPFPAYSPVPVDYATGVTVAQSLTWASADPTYQHNVYFGTSSNAVVNATTSSPEYQGLLSATNFSLASLQNTTIQANTTYFWRVDEVSGTNIGTGVVWRFTTSSNVLGPTAVSVSPALTNAYAGQTVTFAATAAARCLMLINGSSMA